MKTLFALIIFTNPAWAACTAVERPFLSCDFPNGKAVEVCITDDLARYTFGRAGQTPELALTLRFGDGAEFIPWSGVGRSIWEAVRFTNNDVVYEVWGSIDKTLAVEDDPNDNIWPTTGGVSVLDEYDGVLAQLVCTPGTVNYQY